MILPGIDMVKISRMEKALQTKGFAERYFGERERMELSLRGNRAESYAAAFASKEAFGKMLRTGIRGFSLNEVELLHTDNGAPFIALSGAAAEIAESRGIRVSVSITHEGEYAVAMLIGEETGIAG